MRPIWGQGGNSKKRATSEEGATTQPSTTAPAHRLTTRKPPLKAKVEFSDVVHHTAAVPAAPRTPSTPANVVKDGRCDASRQMIRPIATAAPTRSAWARQSVP